MLSETTIALLIQSATALADLMEHPADYPDEMFECFVPVEDVLAAHQALQMVEDERTGNVTI